MEYETDRQNQSDPERSRPALFASCLVALGGDRHAEAAAALRAVAKLASPGRVASA